MSYIPDSLRRDIEARANGCCEYCRLGAGDNLFPHEVDHIISEKHRGKTELDNLCLSCFDCNRFKGSDIGSVDEVTHLLTPLYHPRRDSWNDHFTLEAAQIVPTSAIGRVTVFLLRLNSEVQLKKRAGLSELGRYPCNPKSN